MITTAEKTTKPAPAVVKQKAAGTTFFGKAGEEGFFGPKAKPAFFNAPVQAKLTVSNPDDPQEKEADTVAEKVMAKPEPVMAAAPADNQEEKPQREEEEAIQTKVEASRNGAIQAKPEPARMLPARVNPTIRRLARQAAGSQETIGTHSDTENILKRKNTSVYPSDVVQRSARASPGGPGTFQQSLAASKGGGSALPGPARQFMENRFDADFSGVRIHSDASAENLSRSVQAQAFAHGHDIYFNSGKYSPDTTGGRTLLAHELTHTVQQGASPVKNTVSPKPVNKASPVSIAALPSPIAAAPDRVRYSRPAVTLDRAPEAAAPGRPAAATVDLSNKSGGSGLPADAREFFQDSYQADVSDIRVHLDEEAADICRSRRVPAFTQGRHICFEPSRYAPTTEEGGTLLAKQVSESLNQRSVRVPGLMSQISAARQPEQAPGSPAKAKPESKGLAGAADKKKPGPKGKEPKTAREKGAGAKTKGKPKAGKADGPPVKTVKADPKKSPSTPEEDPAFQKAVGQAKGAAKKQKQHDPAESKATDAQKAAPAAPKEAEGQAQKRKTDGMENAGKSGKAFDEKSFKAELLKKIESITPKTLEEATEFKENNKIGEVKNVMGDKVSQEKQATTGPVTQATAQPLQVNEADNKKPLPLPPTAKGPMPAGPGAKEAAPKPKLNNEISLQEQSKSLDEEMKANNVTEEQLAKSNEPSFTEALAEKKGAQKDAAQKPLQYRKDEVLMLNQARAGARQESARAVTGMDAARGKNFGAVVQEQETTKQKDQERRATVAKEIETLYTVAEGKVNTALEAADTEANRIFDEGSEAARIAFEDYVEERMRAYKRRRYSGFWGGLRWAKDKIFGMPDEVNAFYSQGRQLYLDKMDMVITQVARTVTTKLNEAKQAILDGKKAIDDYVGKLPKDLAGVGKEAATNIQDKFDALEQSVNDKKDQLIEGLAKKYVDNVKKLDDRIGELKEANQGLIDKAIGFLKKVWQIIKDLTSLFTTILAKLAAIIGVILGDPGGFFDNLGKAFSLGFNNFKKNFLGYLEQGLMDWLKTNLGIAGLKMPEKFDAGAIFGLALQVMGITKENIRERAVLLLGERKVALLEAGGELLSRIYNEGFGVVWEMIYEKLSDFKDIVWEAIKSFIQSRVVEAAITFLLSMLNPIGAFIKVCMAIYDFLMMLVRFKDRIIELLDTILNAVTNIASGEIDGAAKAIEGAFAKSIPVIIGFLAALLHLNDIAAKVRDIIMRVKGRVEKAIDWVLKKAVGLVKNIAGAGKKAVGAALGFAKRLLGLEKRFQGEDGAGHRLYFAPQGNDAQLMVNPTPTPYQKWVAAIITEDGSKKDQKKTRALAVAQEIDREKATKATGTGAQLEKAEEAKAERIRELMDELSALTGPLFAGDLSNCAVEGKGLAFGSLHGGKYGTRMTAEYLTKIRMPAGSVPSVAHHSSYAIINQRRNQGGSYYVLGHLLNHNLGGTGADWRNLTPLTREANRAHEYIAEARVKNAVNAGNMVYYHVEAKYGRSSGPGGGNATIREIMKEEAHVPTSLVCHAEMVTPAGTTTGKEKRVPLVPAGTVIENNVSQRPEDYDLAGIRRETVYLNTRNVNIINSIDGVDRPLAQKIVDAWRDKMRNEGTRFGSFAALAEYVFPDGRSFTSRQQAIINTLPDYVSLYSNQAD